MKFPFVGGSYKARSTFVDASETINLYPEISNKTGTSKAIAALYGTPGLKLWQVFAGGAIRGMHRLTTGVAVVVAGLNVYMVTTAGVPTFVAKIDNDATPASMDDNGTVVMIVTGNHGYFLDPVALTITVVVNPVFTGADTVQFIDGYFLFNKPSTGEFQISGLYSESIDALDFATAEDAPDNLMSVLVDHDEVWLFGEVTTEVWGDSGSALFPFARIPGAVIEQGTAAKFSPVKMDETVYWLGADRLGKGVVQRANGYQSVRVSNHSVETAINSYSRIDDAIGYAYQQEGHNFYMLSFPTANVTWCYDSSTDEWHKRAYRDPTTATLNRHRSVNHMAFGGINLVGDWQNGNVYQLDLNTYTDNGDILPAIRRTPYMYADGRWMFFRRMYLDMEVGIGLVNGLDPQIMLDWSDDGGVTFDNEIVSSAGKLGERTLRQTFNRLGKSRGRVWQITITDPVKRALIGADAVYTVGAF